MSALCCTRLITVVVDYLLCWETVVSVWRRWLTLLSFAQTTGPLWSDCSLPASISCLSYADGLLTHVIRSYFFCVVQCVCFSNVHSVCAFLISFSRSQSTTVHDMIILYIYLLDVVVTVLTSSFACHSSFSSNTLFHILPGTQVDCKKSGPRCTAESQKTSRCPLS